MPPLPLVALLLFVAQPGAYAFLGGDGRSGEALPTVRPPVPPYGSLFSQEGLQLWSRDALHEEHRPHHRQFDDRQDFEDSKHLADYLQMRSVEAIHMPLPLNIIFIGFRGDGNYGVDFKAEEMAEWFETLDHVVPHIYVPERELQCQENGTCGGWHTPSSRAAASHVHYNLSCHTHELGPDVAETFERALRLFSRPVDPLNPAGPHQVDAALMEGFVTGMLSAIGLHPSGYSLVVLNPKWDPNRPRYGYRVGLSPEEARYIATDAALMKRASSIGAHKLRADHDEFGATDDNDPHGWQWYRPKGKFAMSDKRVEVDAWLRTAAEALQGHEDQLARLKAGGVWRKEEEVEGDGAQKTRMDFLRRITAASESTRHTIQNLLYKAAHETPPENSDVLAPDEGCLVDTWIAHGRWAMVDLTAGGEDWGPESGSGGGRRTRHSLPSLGTFFPSQDSSMGGAGGSDAGSEIDIQRRHLLAKEWTGPPLSDVKAAATQKGESARLSATMSHVQAMAQGRYTPGAEPDHQEQLEDEDLAGLRAERDVFQFQFDKHCEGVEKHEQNSHCQHLLRELSLVDTEVKELMRDAVARQPEGSEKAAQRMAQLQARLFGPNSSRGAGDSGTHIQQADRQRDLFLAQLGDVLSRAIRHVVVPPTATWHEGDAVWHSPAEVRLPTKVAFTVYLVTDLLLSQRQRARMARDAFDVAALRKELIGLQLPGQSFSVTSRPLALADDSTLAAAMAVALRPVMSASTGEVTLSLDSAAIHRQINSRDPATARSSRMSSLAQAAKEVPIFVFLVSRDVPIFIDGQLLAKSLPDSVIAVQNVGESASGPHPSGMMCGSRRLALSATSTLEATIAAVVQNLSGRLPPHLGYSPVHDAVTHDWTWCAGATAQSLTSPGLRLGQFARDAIIRHYALRVLDASAHQLNRIVQRFSEEPTEEDLFRTLNAAAAPSAHSVLDAYDKLLGLWRLAVKDAEAMDHASMFGRLKEVESATEELNLAAEGLQELLHPSRCTRRRRVRPGLTVAAAAILSVGAIACYLAWPRDRLKPKIN